MKPRFIRFILCALACCQLVTTGRGQAIADMLSALQQRRAALQQWWYAYSGGTTHLAPLVWTVGTWTSSYPTTTDINNLSLSGVLNSEPLVP